MFKSIYLLLKNVLFYGHANHATNFLTILYVQVLNLLRIVPDPYFLPLYFNILGYSNLLCMYLYVLDKNSFPFMRFMLRYKYVTKHYVRSKWKESTLDFVRYEGFTGNMNQTSFGSIWNMDRFRWKHCYLFKNIMEILLFLFMYWSSITLQFRLL